MAGFRFTEDGGVVGINQPIRLPKGVTRNEFADLLRLVTLISSHSRGGAEVLKTARALVPLMIRDDQGIFVGIRAT